MTIYEDVTGDDWRFSSTGEYVIEADGSFGYIGENGTEVFCPPIVNARTIPDSDTAIQFEPVEDK